MSKTPKHWTDTLEQLLACSEAVEWAKAYPILQAAWDACERGDWMLWLWGKFAGEPWSDLRRPLVLAACECARTALQFVSPGEDRPRLTIEYAEAWARGEHEDREKVWPACTAYAAAYAAYVATYAASTCAATCAAYAAAYAAYYAAAARSNRPEAAYAAKRQTLKICADIVRRHCPKAPAPVASEGD